MPTATGCRSTSRASRSSCAGAVRRRRRRSAMGRTRRSGSWRRKRRSRRRTSRELGGGKTGSWAGEWGVGRWRASHSPPSPSARVAADSLLPRPTPAPSIHIHMAFLINAWVWVGVVLIVLFGFPIMVVIYAFTAPFDPGRYIAGRFFRLMGVAAVKINPLWTFRTDGRMISDPRRPYVAVSNHISYADIFLISHLPWEMKWLAKDTIFKIPVMGWMMWMAGDIPLKRGSRDSAMAAINA